MNSNTEINRIINSNTAKSSNANLVTNMASNNRDMRDGNSKDSNSDPDEQFVLDIIRSTKQESIQSLTELLRQQESKSVLLIRVLERYTLQLDNKDLFK